MTLLRDMVEETRSMLQGTLADEISILQGAYTPGSGAVQLQYPKKNLQPGSLISVGLNTFYVLGADASGQNLAVHASADGGPDVAVAGGEVVRIRPRYSTWAIFREIQREIQTMSSPRSGLYAFGSFTASTNWLNGTYPLPASWAPQQPVKLLMARYKAFGRQWWQRIEAEWQPDQNMVRIFGVQPRGGSVEFVLSFPYLTPTTLDDVAAALGLNEFTDNIPCLGAAANLSRSGEARRNQTTAQGDSRRPNEVPPGSILGVSREFARQQQEQINDETARLVSMFGYWKPQVGLVG